MKLMRKPGWLNSYAVIAAGALAVLSLVGFLASGSGPDKVKQETTLVSYAQTGKFSYQVYLKPSFLYGPPPQDVPANVSLPLAATGNINFTYNFTPTNQAWSGSASVQAVLENPGIWQKRINLVSQSSVTGAFTLSLL
jgi:hypothetical protein